MASSASTVLRQELMAAGENDGTWGPKMNTNLGILESAVTGTTAVATTGGSTTLTNVDYTNDQSKKAILDVTGALVSNATIVIPNASKTYKIFNRTSGSYTLTIKTSGGSGIEITQSTACEVYCDGSNTVRFGTPMVNFGTGAPATASGAAASAVSVTPTGNLSSSNAQAALAELQGDIDTINTTLVSSYQPLDADLTTLAGLAKTDGGFIVGDGANWIVETADTARTSLGVGTGDSPQFTALNIGSATDTTVTRDAVGQIAVEGVRIPTISSTNTLTNKTLNLASNTLTGTTAEFNTALSDGNFATQAGTETLTNKTLTSPAINTPTIIGGTAYGTLVRATAQASTSGTSIDFTSIPSGVKRITVMFEGVSVNSSDEYLIQIGDSGGVETSSYFGSLISSAGSSSSTSGFLLSNSSEASDLWYGVGVICNIDGNKWVFSGAFAGTTASPRTSVGSKELSATLDRVRITTTGSGTFDAGTINIIYE